MLRLMVLGLPLLFAACGGMPSEPEGGRLATGSITPTYSPGPATLEAAEEAGVDRVLR